LKVRAELPRPTTRTTKIGGLAQLEITRDLHGSTPPAEDAGLIDHEVIPLSLALADAVITQLRAAATEVREEFDRARRA
jgi:hypothetical protein